jgi:hypothetical protein
VERFVTCAGTFSPKKTTEGFTMDEQRGQLGRQNGLQSTTTSASPSGLMANCKPEPSLSMSPICGSERQEKSIRVRMRRQRTRHLLQPCRILIHDLTVQVVPVNGVLARGAFDNKSVSMQLDSICTSGFEVQAVHVLRHDVARSGFSGEQKLESAQRAVSDVRLCTCGTA